MESINAASLADCKKTKQALIFLTLASQPMSALYSLMPFILIKDLAATPLQLAIFVSLRPILSFFSFYWGFFFNKSGQHLIKNIRIANGIAYLPCCLFAWSNEVWLLIGAFACFQLFHRAGIPAWIEVIKRNVPQKKREQTFSVSFAASFIVSGIFGILIGTLLDFHSYFFKFVLFGIAIFGLCSLFILKDIGPADDQEMPEKNPSSIPQCFKILHQRKDFRHFQIVFMIGGATLMLIAPALSNYYAKIIRLSHLDISLARFVFMALGVFCSTYFWNRIFQTKHINVLTIPILCGFGLFPLFLLLAQINIAALYLGFFIYGVAQAGSHLVWNLSGISFSKESSSIPFSQINLLMIGMRGLIFPFIGTALLTGIGAIWTLGIGIAFCFIGAGYALFFNSQVVPKGLSNDSLS